MSLQRKLSNSSLIGSDLKHFNAPSVTFVTLESLRRFLIVFTPTSNYYCVIHIDPYHGALSFSGVYQRDMFSTEQEALDYISNDDPIKSTIRGFSLLGYTTSGCYGILIIIKNAEAQYNLMLKHTIYKIKEVEVIKFNILFPSKYQIDFEKLKLYPFNYNHFFCLTYDIGCPFSRKPKNIPAINAALVVSLQTLNIPNICPYVIQGSFSFAHLDEFKTDAVFITRRVAVDGEIEKGINKNCKPAIEYQIELAFISKIGNGFRILSHFTHIGSIPIVCDSIYSSSGSISASSSSPTINSGAPISPHNDETNDLKFAKTMFEKVTNFVPCSNVHNIFLQKEKQSPRYTKLYQRSMKVCSFTNENVKSSVVKPGVLTFNDEERLEQSVEIVIKILSPILNEIGFSETFYSENETKYEKQYQNGFLRFNILNSCRDELFTMAILFLKEASLCGVLTQQIDRYIDIYRSSASFLQLIGDSILGISESISTFSYAKSSHLKDVLSFIFPPLSPVSKGPLYFDINSSFEQLNLLQPFDWICASYGPNAQVIFPQEVSNSILKCISKAVFVPTKKNDLTILLSRNIYLKEIVIELTDVSNYYPPVYASIKGGLYLNRMYPILENISLPYTKEKHLAIRIPLSPLKNYDPSDRPFDIEPIRFLSFQLLSLSDSITICNITVFGTVDSENDISITKKLRSIEERKKSKQELIVKKPASFYDIIPCAINYEMIRISGDYSVFEGVSKLIQNGIHPDTLDIGLFAIKKPEETNPKKKVCKKCQKQCQCFPCWRCHEYFCKNCLSKQSDHLCQQCFDQWTYLNESKTKMQTLIQNECIENNTFLKSHIDKLNKIKSNSKNPCQCSSEECLVCPKAWTFYEQGKSVDNQPFEICFLDNDTVYRSPSNIIQTVIALETVYEIKMIEIVCDYPLQIFINQWQPQIPLNQTIEPLSFSPPSSSCYTSITAQNIDMTILSERIQIKRIKFYGQPKIEEKTPQPSLLSPRSKTIYRSPLTNEVGYTSSTHSNRYIKFRHISSFNVILSDGDPYHTFTFDEPIDIIGFEFTELWPHLIYLVFQLFPSTAQPPAIITRYITKYDAKEINLLFHKTIKQIKIVRIWYLRLSDKGKSLLNNPPTPLVIDQ